MCVLLLYSGAAGSAARKNNPSTDGARQKGTGECGTLNLNLMRLIDQQVLDTPYYGSRQIEVDPVLWTVWHFISTKRDYCKPVITHAAEVKRILEHVGEAVDLTPFG